MHRPYLGEHRYFFSNGIVHSGDIIQIEYFINSEKGWLINIQSTELGDKWMGYYLTFSTKQEALDYKNQQIEKLRKSIERKCWD